MLLSLSTEETLTKQTLGICSMDKSYWIITSSSVYEAYKAGADDLDKDVRPPPHLYLSHLVWLMGLTQTRTLYVSMYRS